MVVGRLVDRLRRRVRRPLLSVLVLGQGAGSHLEGAIRSVLNQSFKNLEVLVVLDREPGEGAADEQTATRLAVRDRRIRVLHTDLDSALARARGRLLTIVCGCDGVLAGAYQTMTQSLECSGSDVVIAGSRPLTGPPTRRWAAGHAGTPRRRAGLVDVPDTVDDLVAGAVLAPRRLWALTGRGSVGVTMPERTLAVLLRGRTIDVLDQEVYAWRAGSMATGPSADSDPETLLETVDALARMAAQAPPAVRCSLLVGRLSRDLVSLAEHSPQAPPGFVERLRRTALTILPADGDPLWGAIGLLDRVLLWVLAHPGQDGGSGDLEEVIGSRAEDLGFPSLAVDGDSLYFERFSLDRIGAPRWLTEVSDVDLRLGISLDTVRWTGPSALEVNGCAWIAGVDPCLTHCPVIEVVDETGETLSRAAVERCQAPRADLGAADPWRSYLASGITARLEVESGSRVRFRVLIRVAGRLVVGWLPEPAGSRRSRISPPGPAGRLRAVGDNGLLRVVPVGGEDHQDETPPGGAASVVLTEAFLSLTGELELIGTATGVPASLDLVLHRHRDRVLAPATLTSEGIWSACFDLAGPEVELGVYLLRWRPGAMEQAEPGAGGSCTSGEKIDGPAIELPADAENSRRTSRSTTAPPRRTDDGPGTRRPPRRARVMTRKDGSVAVAIIAPLTVQERSRRGRHVLIERDVGPVRPGVFLESFGGRSGGDNPAAICADLAAHGITAPLWWSVVDGTVPVPAGAVPVVVGSQEWIRAIRASRVVVTNDHLPSWFSKRNGQYLLQTWHGTPIKKLLDDAAPGAVTASYRRLMARQVQQWDLLLAQNEEARGRLCQVLGYRGEVRVGEYPRNVGLLGGSELRQRVRTGLGVRAGQRVVLYAPTWREALRSSEGDQELLDCSRLSRELDAVILVRMHHMNMRRSGRPGLIDVSRYPSVEELMVAADVLVSDYSSIFSDFALTGKPAVVYAPDLEHYRDVERGLYGHWPQDSGLPVALDQDELASHLRRILGAVNDEKTTERIPGIDPESILDNLAWIRRRIIHSLIR